MILATAGHVDHGKTSLVRALTGVDTDRLPEEKRRGMSIDLGFAYRDDIGFVDVPGHQGFIRNTLAGLAGVDQALLVVAADDGPMPQTLEHLAVLALLEVPLAAVVLTKADRVPAARVEEVSASIAQLLRSQGLPEAPVFPVATPAGQGIAELQGHIARVAAALPPRASSGQFRLAVDRAFTVSGAGLVLTGTVVSGRIDVGAVVGLLSGGGEGKVRGLHAQNQPAQSCHAGQRAALNVAGALPRPEAIARGDWLVVGDPPEPVARFDALLRVPAGMQDALKHWTAVHVHLASAHVTGRIAVLEGTQVEPGASALVRLELGQPLGAVAGDRFIVRDAPGQRTLAGGRVLDVFPPARGRARPERLAELRLLAEPDAAVSLQGLLEASPGGVLLEPFRRNRNLSREEAAMLFDGLPESFHGNPEGGREQAAALFDGMPVRRVATARGPLAFAPRHWAALEAAASRAVAAFHEREPALAGPPPDRILLQQGLRLARETVLAIAAELVRTGALVRRGIGVALPTHAPRLTPADEALWQQVRPLLEAGGLRPPSVFELGYALRTEPKRLEAMLVRAAQCGHAVRVSARHWFLPGPVLELAQAAQSLAAEQDGAFTAASYRDRAGVGRNLSIELLEFFSHVKYTRRVGDRHVLLAAPRDVFAGGGGH